MYIENEVTTNIEVRDYIVTIDLKNKAFIN
jgi:hypothetical protein